MKIGFIGTGKVGFTIADSLQKQGHTIILGFRDKDSASLKEAVEKNPLFASAPMRDMVGMADLIVLATPFQANQGILQGLAFGGKTLVDCTNPVGPGITHGLKSERSGAEAVQDWAPDAKVVKAFNIYGFENLGGGEFPGYNVKPLMLIAGDHQEAKEQVAVLLGQMGFFVKDTGGLHQALHLEHMTLLWVKMVRASGHHPNFVWAYLERNRE
jgi:predicted dinucleotide-binding enzyme